MRNLITLFCLIFVSNSLHAQYNIEANIETDSLKALVQGSDNIEKKEIAFSVLNDAYLKNQKKMLKKSRNTFETTNSLLISQYGYNNWAAGGENTFNGQVTSYLKHIYKLERFDVTSYWDAAYATGIQDSVLWKSEDRFRINTAINYSMNDHFFYNLSLDLSSQFANGYTSTTDTIPASSPFAPATITIGFGLNYKLDDNRSIIFSPISGSMTTVLDEALSEAGAYGVEPGERTTTSLGIALTADWTQSIFKDKETKTDILSCRTSMQSFWQYGGRTPSLTWQSWLTLSAYKYFNVSFTWTAKFDDKVDTPKGSFWQFSEVLGLGVTYTFKSKTS